MQQGKQTQIRMGLIRTENWREAEPVSIAAVLAPPRVNGFARILLPDGTERVSGFITEIKREP